MQSYAVCCVKEDKIQRSVYNVQNWEKALIWKTKWIKPDKC